MTVNVSLRSEQSDPLSWSQVDGNFSGLASQVNTNTENIVAVTETANTAATEATEALTQIAALDVSTTVDWFASSTFYESLPVGAKGFFTPGTTTTLVLSNAYGTTSNVQPDFDGLIQGLEQFTLSGTSIIFDSAIPIGVENVHVKGGGILVANVPSNGSVGVPQLAADTLAFFVQQAVLAMASGSSAIGDLQPGGITSTVRQIFSEFVSVFRYFTAEQIADVIAYTYTLDVSAAIQTAITKNPFLWFPPGGYLMAEQVNVPVSRTMMGAGKNVSIFKTIANFATVGGLRILFNGGNGVAKNWTVIGLGFNQNKSGYTIPPTDQADCALYAYGACDNFTVRDCAFSNIATGSNIVTQGTGCLIDSNLFLQNGFNAGGSAIVNPVEVNGGAVGTRIVNNYFDSTTDFMIGVEPATTGIDIANNIFNNTYSIGNGAIGGFGTGPISDIRVHGNIFLMSSTPGYCIQWGPTGAGSLNNIDVTENTFIAGNSSAILIGPEAFTTGSYTNLIFSGNRFIGSAGNVSTQAAIQIINSSASALINNVVIQDNYFSTWNAAAVTASDVTDIRINGNTCIMCAQTFAQEAPFNIVESNINEYQRIEISNNYSRDNGANAFLVWLNSSAPSTVQNFIIKDNTMIGSGAEAILGNEAAYQSIFSTIAQGNFYARNLMNGTEHSMSIPARQTGANGVQSNVGQIPFSLIASGSQDILWVDFDSLYGVCMLSVDITAMGAAAGPLYVSAKRYIAFFNGVPTFTEIGADYLLGATISFSLVGTSPNRIKATITSTIAQVERGVVSATCVGGGSATSGAAGAILTLL